ncbi:family 65 glycosyl hydrolase [Alkalibaculum sp. M08DMB]|uniref:Family 65 glycosyl hydrolase n=1 Tax=Alkalibaculum sporogenes TaxID=2655001 RepID=A0A6A7K4Q4_9FIRM|nr:glycosyl hydrolase family 65 protein [Alkalibaculum sporogenes]MPW24439.1 family 65 glycosyl hydrolase [Alkalibaculum sporogenes]
MQNKYTTYILNEQKLDNYNLLLNETLFHNANGYIGVRSVFEEGYPDGFESIRGQYINGFYDFSQMKQAENLYGLTQEKQTMLNIADTQSIILHLEDEKFSMFEGKVLDSIRWVDMEKGVTGRYVQWRSPKGKEIELTIIRMTSFHQLTLFTTSYEVKPLNFSGEITIESSHDGNVLNYTDCNDPRVADDGIRYLTPISCEIKKGASYITSKTTKSNCTITSCVKNILLQDHERQFTIDNNNAICQMTTEANLGGTIKLIKYAVFCDSIRYEDCREQAGVELEKALSTSLESLYKKQEDYLSVYWNNCDVKIEGDDELSRAMHYNLYQLIQSVGKDEHSNIAPKGLSGEGYEGHYFWDTEMYIEPFFTVTNPSITKNLINYRFSILEMAKENARILGHSKGALYPWRTIMGKECSGYFPAGSAQYHINGDIAYSIIAYYLATKDLSLLKEKGGEIIFETARLWMDTGNFHNDIFYINDITGPDEYTCIVNNNYYTNVIAQYHLNWAVKVYDLLKNTEIFDELVNKIDLKFEEIEDFHAAADAMYLAYDSKLKINPQDDSFLQKRRLDLQKIPKDKFPLLLYYHPLHLYRHQVCKQPDTIMAHFIIEDVQSLETMRNSYDYYEEITTHDSSLSDCIFGIMAAKLGMEEKSFDYFCHSAKLDLKDKHKNTKHGIHTANMGGNYMAIVYGFGGFRLKEEGIFFAPILPVKWVSYQFKISYEDSRIIIIVKEDICCFRLEHGSAKTIHVYDKIYHLKDMLIINRRYNKEERS